MRLDKYISHCSALSRKDSRKAIKAGNVAVNAVATTNPGVHISSDDVVALNDQILALPQYRYFMINKPQNVVSASRDSANRCVTDLLAEQPPGLQLAGRLDKDATGLVLLSDDGQWIHQIIAPNKHCWKTYLVTTDIELPESAAKEFERGIKLTGEGKSTLPAMVEKQQPLNYCVRVREGRYHQVKRMFAHFNVQVLSLHRTQIGAIELDDTLSPGAFRLLTNAEIASVAAQ